MANFLTVKEAAQRVGKSSSSIRRIIYPILEDDRHPDRVHIEPDVETATALRLKGESFPWKLSEDLLRRAVPEGSVTNISPLMKARTFSAIHDAKRREIELKKLQGSLIDREDARRACLAVVAEIRTRLDGLPSQAAPLAHSAPTVAEAETAIRAVLRSCLVEVAKLGEAFAA